MKVADMHCDTISELYFSKDSNLWKNHLHIDLQKLIKGDYLLQNFALYTDISKTSDPFEHCMKMIDHFYREMDQWHQSIAIAVSYDQILKNQSENKISAVLTIEEGGVCRGELAHLRNFYRLGVRMMTLTWNYPNELAYPNARYHQESRQRQWLADEINGLTPTGIQFVEEMERLGMIIDVSHLSDAGIYDLLKYGKKPFVASHSNARALASHPRNLTDQMVKSMAERGCLIGINYCAAFLRDWATDDIVISTVADMVRHIKHLKNIGGINCIGLGSDFDGIDDTLEIKSAANLSLLEHEMRKQGFSGAEIEAVFYQNVMSLYRELL